MSRHETQRKAASLRREIGKKVVGNEDVIEHMLICLLAQGHILIESPPGLGKTLISKAMAEAMDLSFRRIQCTPDLTPKDVIGEMVLDDQLGGRFFSGGPIFTNVLLVDEINRTQPKTQSAFLEAMAECGVTVLGQTHRLPEPFFVIATQNPIEHEGTYELPEAQQDRFLLKTKMTYLSPHEEREAVKSSNTKRGVERVLEASDVLEVQKRVREDIGADDAVVDYIVSLVGATRARREVTAGASTRASILYLQAAKARAFLQGRNDIKVEDVKALAHPILRHRLVMNPDSRSFGYTPDNLIDDLLRKAGPP